ncbi:MAG TPA: AAA family ATPase [Pseudonocardiaceae bacterium]
MTPAQPAAVLPIRPGGSGRPDPFAAAWTADALMAARFPEPKWAVPGVLAEGVSILAGPPKVGKSWVSLGLALAIAGGRDAFDRIPVDPGPVLYLALEDTPRRLQRRMGMLLAGQPAPADLTLLTAFPALNQGGDTAIAGWLARNPSARLVVIDVFAKIRGTAAAGLSAYDADYAAVGRIKKVADHYGVAVVLVHHVRKASSDDFLQEVSGTNGIAGAADATLVLRRARNEADGILSITGRDVEEAEHALTFDSDTGTWRMLDGPTIDHTISGTRATILRYLRDHPGAMPRELAAPTGLTHDNARRTCARMADAGQLTTDGTGRYYAPATTGGTADRTGTVPPVPPQPSPQVEALIEVGQPGRATVPPVSHHHAKGEQ